MNFQKFVGSQEFLGIFMDKCFNCKSTEKSIELEFKFEIKKAYPPWLIIK
jgi:hypothetical protein